MAAEPAGEVEQWRFRRQPHLAVRRYHRVVACRGTGIRHGFRGHVQINRDFDVDELPHLIAFLASVWEQLYEPPF
jgi:hypothetical protein